MAIALISIPATVVLAVALFTFNALVPETYASLLRFADWIWQGSLDALNNSGDTLPGARALANLARQGFSGHHYVIMALCSSLAAFVVNAFFSFGRQSKEHPPRARIEVASPPESYKAALTTRRDVLALSPTWVRRRLSGKKEQGTTQSYGRKACLVSTWFASSLGASRSKRAYSSSSS